MFWRWMSRCVMIVDTSTTSAPVLDGRVEQPLDRHRRAEVRHRKPVLLDAAVLDVEDLAHPDRVLVLAHRGGDDASGSWSVTNASISSSGEQLLAR